MVSKNDFLNRINDLPGVIPSISGKASYSKFVLKGSILSFQRNNPKTNWVLDIEMLWKVYKTQNFINTSVIKKLTGGRVNSPSVAILLAIGCIDSKGNRL